MPLAPFRESFRSPRSRWRRPQRFADDPGLNRPKPARITGLTDDPRGFPGLDPGAHSGAARCAETTQEWPEDFPAPQTGCGKCSSFVSGIASPGNGCRTDTAKQSCIFDRRGGLGASGSVPIKAGKGRLGRILGFFQEARRDGFRCPNSQRAENRESFSRRTGRDRLRPLVSL